MTRFRRELTVGVMVVTTILATVIGGGCSEQPVKLKSNEQPVNLKSNFSVERARAFKRFPVYYAGDKLGSLPLTSVNSDPITAPPGTAVARKLAGAKNVVSLTFTYGSCVIPPNGESCGLPITIEVAPACARYPALYTKQGPGGPTPRKTRIRGVSAAYFESGYRLEIQTGSSTVVIFGSRPRILAAASALQGLNVNVGPGQKLPAPVPGALDGTLPCA